MDTVFIRGLEVRTIVGIEEWERRERQTVRIDVDLGVDVRPAAASGDVEASVNYRSVAKLILGHLEDARYELVETMAERLAALVLESTPAEWVRLRVAKPGAVRFSDEVGVDIRRERGA